MKKHTVNGVLTAIILLIILTAIPYMTFAEISPNEPVLNMLFENNLTDSSIYHNNGSLSGTTNLPVFTDGQNGKALSFNGQGNGYVSIPDVDSLDMGTSDFTISVWVKVPNGFTSPCYLLEKTDYQYGYSLQLFNGTALLGVCDNNNHISSFISENKNPDGSISKPNMADGNWHHLAVTVDRDSPNGVVFYIDNIRYSTIVDGSRDITYANGSIATATPFCLGTEPVNYHYYYQGLMDNLIIVKRALTVDEVTQLYQIPKLAGYWSFDGNALDQGPYGNHGTLTGNPGFIPGAFNQALHFNGSNYMQVPNSASVNFGSGDYSIACWFRTTDTTKTVNTIIDKRDAYEKGYHVCLYSGRLLIQMSGYNFWGGNNSPAFNDGLWHLAVFTVDRDNPSGLKVYIDGRLLHTFNPMNRPGDLTNTAPLYIGRHKDNYNNFSGDLDEVRLYKSVLSESDIAGLNKRVVYTTGFYSVDGTKPMPCYWTGNNTTPTSILPAGASWGQTGAIVYANGTIYCGGYYNDGAKNIPYYWTGNNTTSTQLLPAGASLGMVYSMVYANGTTYCAGFYNDGTKDIPCYWTGNNAAPTLLLLPPGASNGRVYSIAYANGTIYCGGFYDDGTKAIPCYWTGNNATPTPLLPTGGRIGFVTSMVYVSGTIYCGGYYDDGAKAIPCYWTGNNATPIPLLPTGGRIGFVTSMVYANGTIYCGGYYNNGTNDIPCYWTGNNATPTQLLPTGALAGRISSIVYAYGTIYCGGSYFDGTKGFPCYWTGNNATPTSLLPTGASFGEVYSISVN